MYRPCDWNFHERIGTVIVFFVEDFFHFWVRTYPNSFIFESCLRSSSKCIYPGVYAIVGASAVLGGATRLTVCLAVTMFEVTGSLIYIIPIMVSTVTSKMVGDFFGSYGIYDIMVSWKKYPYIPPTSEADSSVTAQTIMSANPVCIGAFSETLESLSIPPLFMLISSCLRSNAGQVYLCWISSSFVISKL